MADKENKAAEDSKVEKASTDEAKAAEKVAKAAKGSKTKSNKPKASARLKQYFRDVNGERKKIIWPDARTVLKSTGVVLLVVAIVSIIIYGIDQGLAAGIKGLKSLATDETTVSQTVEGESTSEGETTTAADSKDTTTQGKTTEADASTTEKTTAEATTETTTEAASE